MSDTPPEDVTLDYDVIIVGAGLAGLTTAKELKQRDPTLRVLVLEAADRVGGRTCTVDIKVRHNRTEKFDLGGQWVGPTQKHVLALMDELGLKKYEQFIDGAKVAQFGISKPRKYNTTLPIYSIRQFGPLEMYDTLTHLLRTERLARKFNVRDNFSWKRGVYFDETSILKFTREHAFTRAALDVAHIVTRSVYGAEPGSINMLYHLKTCKAAGAFENLLESVGDGANVYKVVGGTQQMSEKLAAIVGRENVLLNKAVSRVEAYENSSTAKIFYYERDDPTKVSTLTSSRIVLAIPPNQCGKLKFYPELPLLKKRLFESPMGNLTKFIITYETAFWREEGYSGEIISTGYTIIPGEIQPISITFDATSPNGDPAIVGFVHEEYCDRTKSDRCNAVVSDLVRFLGDKAFKQFISYEDKVWMKEEFTGGCPSAYATPGNMDAWNVIREPFYTIHFAGTETAFEWNGYMTGAIESGVRAAHEVLYTLERHDLVSYTALKGSFFDNDYSPPLPPANYYDETLSPWWRRIFFFTAVGFGIYAYSKKYRLSYTAKAVQPVEHWLIKKLTGIVWPT